jgi:hypothetical protein
VLFYITHFVDNIEEKYTPFIKRIMRYFPVDCPKVLVSKEHLSPRNQKKMVDIDQAFKHTTSIRYDNFVKVPSHNSFLYSKPFRPLFLRASESDLTLVSQGENATMGNLDRD